MAAKIRKVTVKLTHSHLCENKCVRVKTCICKDVINSRDKREKPVRVMEDERLFTLIEKKKKCVGGLQYILECLLETSAYFKEIPTNRCCSKLYKPKMRFSHPHPAS